MGKTLFEPVVEESKRSRNFEIVRTADSKLPARRMLDDIFESFHDPDGNFIADFQSANFDARLFELYLFAYFSRSGFAVDRGERRPDFMVTRNGVTVAVEATTVNPSESGELKEAGRRIEDLGSQEEMEEYEEHELAVRFGSPLFSKLNERYWELPHCRDLPLVFAIQAFHEQDSHFFTGHALTNYAYGVKGGTWRADGTFERRRSETKEHVVGKKSIPSNFFAQPNAEHVSAIMFTNSGTAAKFSRMGFQHGYGCEALEMGRSGWFFNPDPAALYTTHFMYDMADPPFVESWGQGLVVLHNPHCNHPVSHGFFPEAAEHRLVQGEVKTEVSGWHPFQSKTLTFQVGEEAKRAVRSSYPSIPTFFVEAIPKEEFEARVGFSSDRTLPVREVAWFADDTRAFLGVVVRDRSDGDWGYIALARDQHFRFRAIATEHSLPAHENARIDLQLKIADLRRKPQRIFPQ